MERLGRLIRRFNPVFLRLAIGSLALAGCLPKPLQVDMAPVKRGEIVAKVSAPGNIAATNEVQISAYVMGIITQLPVAEGEFVKKGQKLVQIDPTPYAAMLGQSQANLALAMSGLSQSRADFTRNSDLFKQSLISPQQMETSATQYHSDSDRVGQAQAALAQAQDQLNKTAIYSPLNGTVTQLNVKKGEIVVTGTMNIPGSVLMTVSDLTAMEFDAQVDESDLPSVALGQEALLSMDALPDTSLFGDVIEVGRAPIGGQGQASTAGSSVSYLVKIKIPGRLRTLTPGMSGSADITVADKKNILYVPIQAVVTREVETEKSQSAERSRAHKIPAAAPLPQAGKEKEHTAVYVGEGGFARVKAISIGISDPENIEITGGLKEGQDVISGPFSILRTLKDGDRVTVKK